MDVVMPLMIMLTEVMSEQDVLETMREAISKYQMGGGKDKSELCMAALMITIKFRPDKISVDEMMKQYYEHNEWQKLKLKNS